MNDPILVAVRTTRLMAVALAVGPVMVLALVTVFEPSSALGLLQIPAGALGLILPVVAYRLFLYRKSRLDPQRSEAERCSGYVSGFIVAAAVSEGAALVGSVTYVLTRHPATLLGLAMHLVILGAIWPSEDRVHWFIEPDTEAEV